MLNPIMLDAVADLNLKLLRTIEERNGQGGEPNQMLLDAVNLGVSIAYAISSSALSIAIDVKAIRHAVEARKEVER